MRLNEETISGWELKSAPSTARCECQLCGEVAQLNVSVSSVGRWLLAPSLIQDAFLLQDCVAVWMSFAHLHNGLVIAFSTVL